MVCDDILYQVDHTLSKTMIARTETRMPARTVWLGLAVDDSLTDLENISFYLDFPNLTESYEYLFLLPHGMVRRWKPHPDGAGHL